MTKSIANIAILYQLLKFNKNKIKIYLQSKFDKKRKSDKPVNKR